jgi:hypothetical protein
MLAGVGAGPIAGTYVKYEKFFHQQPIYVQLYSLIKACKQTSFNIISYPIPEYIYANSSQEVK